MQGDPVHPPSSVLAITLLLNSLFATTVAAGDAVFLAVITEAPQHEQYRDAETILITMVLVMLLTPGFLLFSACLSSVSWAWHASSEAGRPIWMDALFGIVGGAALGASYLAQDVMGIRPDVVADFTSQNVIAIVSTSIVLGGGLGFLSGAVTKWILGRAKRSDTTASRLMSAVNVFILCIMAFPGLALAFTFAHFTGRTSGWEVLATPFVYALALMTIVGLGSVVILMMVVLVIGHRVLLYGKGTAILDGMMAVGCGSIALIAGVSFLGHGMDNFADGLSFGVAAIAALGFSALSGVVFGLGWGASSPPA